MTQLTYRCSMINLEGWTFQLIVAPGVFEGHYEQPYETAHRLANAHPDHKLYGPWAVRATERYS